MIVIDSGECEDKREIECGEQFYIDLAGGIENLLNDRDAMVLPEEAKKRKEVDRDKRRKRNKDTKRYYCETCDYAAQSQYDLNIHLNRISCKKKRNNLGNP